MLIEYDTIRHFAALYEQGPSVIAESIEHTQDPIIKPPSNDTASLPLRLAFCIAIDNLPNNDRLYRAWRIRN
jgi:hypothetical protein